MSQEIRDLEAVNSALESRDQVGRQELLHMGIIRESDEIVYRATSEQTLPFRKLYLPSARTGILEPNKKVDTDHQALQVILPGAGTTFSHAATLGDVAGTFHGRKSRNRGNGRKSSQSLLADLLPDGMKRFRVASFPADLPLNGMGMDAPFEFASERGCLAVIRHVVLVLSRLHPERPVFVSGRSTGAMMAIRYAQQYCDVAGALAINPPHPDPGLLAHTIQYMEENSGTLSEVLDSPGVSLHSRSWQGFKRFAPTCEYPELQSLSPTLILVSSHDPLNLSAEYLTALERFAGQNELCTVRAVDSQQNNLWNRKAINTYREVIEQQLQFILQHSSQAAVS